MSSSPHSNPTTNPSTTNSSQASVSQSSDSVATATRGKTDEAWDHCRQAHELSIGCKKPKLVCLHCQKVFAGGGINRFKQHLAGVKGDVAGCRKCPPNVRHQMILSIQGNAEKRKRSVEMRVDFNPFSSQQREHEEHMYNQLEDDDDAENEYEVEEIQPPEKAHKTDKNTSIKSKGNQTQSRRTMIAKPPISGKGKPPTGVGNYFMARTTPGAQPSLKSCWQNKKAIEKCDIAIVKWMIDACIPFNAVNSLYYQHAIDAITSMGPGYKGPNFYAVRGYLLSKNVEHIMSFVESYRETWKKTGCTLMADGWSDQKHRTLINFLVYCPRGTVFLKSVDASEASKTADMLYLLFREVVLYVGPEHVVHMVTDNAANYVAAGRKLEQEFRTMFWSPCATHCINLMLQDIGKLVSVSIIVEHAARITKYIYNHCYPLFLMRKFTKGREILRPGPTRFATNFIALQSILTYKDDLRAMVTSREWVTCAYAKDRKAKKFVEDVLSEYFWTECATIVKLTEPLIRVLRLVDSDERPAMGYLFEAYHCAHEEMLRRFKKRKSRVDPFIRIMNERWDMQLHRNLHAAGFYLNPRFQCDPSQMEKHNTTSGLLDVIERYAFGNPSLQSNLTGEMKLFRNAEHDFGRSSAINDRYLLPPDEWWITYGGCAPNLQKLAVRVLSQTCSSSGCERNWSIFEHIHSKKRNRLEHQRLNDLVYVHYNLRLQQKNYWKGRNYDPIDFEAFVDEELWVAEEDPPTLTNEELESFHRDVSTMTIQDASSDDVINLDKIDDDIGNDDEINEHDACVTNMEAQDARRRANELLMQNNMMSSTMGH